MILEVVIVAIPIAVETELPGSRGGETDDVTFLRFMEKVGDDDYVVLRSAFVPTMECDELALVVKMIDLGELPAESARETGKVAPQSDEVAVQPDDAVKLVVLVPVDRDSVAEPSSFEKFLTLEKHGNARSSENHGGGQRRTFSREPALWVVRAYLLRNPRSAIRHLIVRLAVDDPVEGVVVVAVADCVADGCEGALFVLWSDHRLADGVDEHCVPLRAEAGSTRANALGEPFVVLQILGNRDPVGKSLRYLARP